MPAYIIHLLYDKLLSLNRQGQSPKIGVLGVAQSLISELRKFGFDSIVVHDPYCQESFGATFQPNLNIVLNESDCIIISNPHSDYASITPSSFKENCIVLDSVRMLDPDSNYHEHR